MKNKKLFNEWSVVKFGDIAKQISIRVEPNETNLTRYVGLEHLEPENLDITKFGKPSDVSGQKLLVKKGQIIFGKRRAYQKKVAVADWDCICSAHAMVLEPISEKVLPGFLPFFMQSNSFMDRAKVISEGSLSPTIKWKVLCEQTFSIPSIEQQKHILRLLTKISESKRHTTALLDSSRKFHKIFCRELMVPGLKGQVHRWSELSLPAGWQLSCLGEVASISSGLTPSRSKNNIYFNSASKGVPWVKTLDLNEGALFGTEEFVTREALEETSLKVLPEETVLLAMYGGFNQIGRTSILKVKATTNQAISSLVCSQDLVLPDYCQQWLKTFKGEWRKYAASSRKDPNITKGDVSNFPIVLPPINEQRNILKRVKDSELYIGALSQQLSNINNLMKCFVEID